MADIDIDPFGNHNKTNNHPDEPTGENIPLSPGGLGGGSTWELEPEKETSFGGISLRMKVLREHLKALYRKLSENIGQTSEAFHFNNFELRDRELYYKGKIRPLTIRGGKLRPVADILGKEGLHELGFDTPRGKVMA